MYELTGWLRDHYSVLKDFAGPISTFIGAVAAVSVTGYFARHQKRIAADQAHLAREKLRFDLFNRRLEIFSSIFPMYHAIIGWEGTTEQLAAKERFFKAYQESGFLFSGESGIQTTLGELNDDVAKVTGLQELKGDLMQADKEMWMTLQREIADIQLHKFPAGLEKLRAAMASYLNFHST